MSSYKRCIGGQYGTPLSFLVERHWEAGGCVSGQYAAVAEGMVLIISRWLVRLIGKARKTSNPICSASGALWEEWLARSRRWNNSGLLRKYHVSVRIREKTIIRHMEQERKKYALLSM